MPTQETNVNENEDSEAGLPDLHSVASDGSPEFVALAQVPVEVNGLNGQSVTESEAHNLPAELFDHQDDLERAETFLGEEETEGPLELEMFAEIAMELEKDGANVPSPRKRQRQSVLSPSPFKKRAAMQDAEEDDWAVREAVVLLGSEPAVSQTQAKRFDFTARQEHAVQVGWESQSPARISASVTPRYRDGSHFPKLIEGSTPQSTLRPPRSNATPRPDESIKTPASALRLHHAKSSPRSPSVVPRRIFQPRKSDPSTVPGMSRVSLDPALELIPVRTTRTASVSDQSGAADDEARAVEELEVEDLEDLLPDTPQMAGNIPQSSDEPRTPQDADVTDLLPDEMQTKGGGDLSPVDRLEALHGLEVLPGAGNSTGMLTETTLIPHHPVTDLDADVQPLTEPVLERDSVVPSLDKAFPTFQRDNTSSRPRKSRDALEFASPDPDEEQEDRRLLRSPIAPRVTHGSRWRTANTAEPTLKRSSRSPELLHPERLRPSVRAVNRDREITGEDIYLVDGDGQPLEIDPDYVIPRKHIAKPSRIHGQVDGQSSSYSRISGKRRWNRVEELLLYRTVQKIPLSEVYPLRVVWYLHGECGTISHNLEQFNPQHMKDKMRVIVNARANKRRVVNGRARYFLPASHPDRIAYNEEMDDLRSRGRSAFPTVALEKDEPKSVGDEPVAPEADEDLNDLVSEAPEEAISPSPKRVKVIPLRSNAVKRHAGSSLANRNG